ncbi:response regulator transcription factor [Acidocella sp. MX-AZ02]|uniref:response regulator transcription factor n=2 Tax=Acidocella TaxID=50709 RepID=UPI00028DA6EE|nr:response regulator [Acidocella sp. MX-AZ02]EKM98890.1 two-component response regulator [Acidocella sp. MX-AZ02]
MMRILLIEDDETVASVVTNGMAEANHEVTHTIDGQDGLSRAAKGKFDVMIFDRQLPGGVDGAELLRELRAHDVTTPVLFLSGLGALGDWMTGLEAGGDDYIVKPFVFSELLDRVEALHERRTTPEL